MTEKKNLFEIFGKIVEDVIITPSKQILEPVIHLMEPPKPSTLLPVTETAIFWDYENFPIPRNVDPELFLEVLIPSGLNHRVIAQRVYGNPRIFASGVLELLQSRGFSHLMGLETSKPGVTDHTIDIDCATFCQNRSPPIEVILIAGDVDYLQLIRKLSTLGHEIRLICNQKKEISPLMSRIVPSIQDRRDIMRKCEELSELLVSLAQMLNFMLSKRPHNQVTFQEFQKEVEQRIFQERLKTVMGHLRFLLSSPNYKWQFSTIGDMITYADLIAENKRDKKTQQKLVLMKLGSEARVDQWLSYWQEFQLLFPEGRDQEEILKDLYNNCSFPIIRSRLQQRLIWLLEKEQKESKVDNHANNVPKALEVAKSPEKKDKLEIFIASSLEIYFKESNNRSISITQLGMFLQDKNPNWKQKYHVGQLKNVLKKLKDPFFVIGEGNNIVVKIK